MHGCESAFPGVSGGPRGPRTARRWVAVAIGLATAGPATMAGAASAPTPRVVRFEAAALLEAARATPPAGRLTITGVPLGEEEAPATLAVERFEVFTPDARVVVHGAEGTIVQRPPANRYLRGRIEGEVDSRVYLSVLENGEVRGVATRRGEAWLIAGEPAAMPGRAGGALRAVAVDVGKIDIDLGFRCDQELLPPIPSRASRASTIPPAPPAFAVEGPEKALPTHTARVAIETDFEYYDLFDSVTAATNYAGDLIGFAAMVYWDETDTTLAISLVSLWTTAADPWTQASSSLCSLYQFGQYWNANHAGDSRTIAHFLSGRSTGGGVAWVGVLCAGAFSVDLDPDDGGPIPRSCATLTPEVDAYGGAYGFTGSLSGTFQFAHPTVMRDIVAVSHEIGHNFNSPHTHCYAGIGGNPSPVDKCYTSENGGTGDTCNGATGTWTLKPACACGTASLPGPGALTGGSNGAGNGTIMSYCHLVGGGFTNVAYTFGLTQTSGVAAARVPSRMASHVAGVASGNPACLAAQAPGMPLSDGFETGSLKRWSGSQP